MQISRKVYENIPLFLFGAVTYNFLEIVFRGHTHWSMALTGGICLTILCHVYNKIQEVAWWKKCFIGTFIITCLELITGCIVNLWMGWSIWDYSCRRFHFMGQICLLFSVLWFFLCIPVIWFSRVFQRLTDDSTLM